MNRVWRHIKRGENIDLYLVIAAAVMLSAISVAGINIGRFLEPVTLAVLALFALGLLGNRARIEEIQQELAATRTPFLHEYPDDVSPTLEAATRTTLIGINLQRTIVEHYAMFQAKLARGHSIKVLLMAPHGATIDTSLQRAYRHLTPDAARATIHATLDSLCSLKKQAHNPENLEIRVLDYPIHFGAYACDQNTNRGAIYLELYTYRLPEFAAPRFVLKPEHTEWYEFYVGQINVMWDAAQPWPCTKQPE